MKPLLILLCLLSFYYKPVICDPCETLGNSDKVIFVETKEYSNFVQIPKTENAYRVKSDFQIKCVSKSPVIIKFYGLLANRVETLNSTKYEQPKTKIKGSCYETVAGFKGSKSATGRYECVPFDNESGVVSKSIYVFASGNEEGSGLLLKGGIIPVKPTLEGKVILPCLVNDPSVPLKLLKENKDGSPSESQTLLSSPFDPTQGFILNKHSYKCGDTFICKENSSELKLRVKCPKSIPTNISFHVKKLGDEMEYSCQGAGSMVLVECNNLQECEFIRACNSQVRQRICNTHNSYQCEGSLSSPCLSITVKDNVRGLILCSNDDGKELSRHVFSDVRDQKAFNINFLTGESQPPRTWIDFIPTEYQTWSNIGDFSLFETSQFECNVSKVLGSKGIEWLFELRNGSLVKASFTNEVKVETPTTHGSQVLISFNNTEISKLICRAPFLYKEGKWLETWKPIRISPYLNLKLEDWREVETREVSIMNRVDDEHRLTCTATGVGVTISWFKNGWGVGGTHSVYNHKVNHTLDSSLVIYHDISGLDMEMENDKDNYTCTAVDILGQNYTKVFSISWKKEGFPYLLVFSIVLGLLCLFLVLSFIMMRIMRLRDPYYVIIKEFQQGTSKSRNQDEENMDPEDGHFPSFLHEPYDNRKFEIHERNIVLLPKEKPVPLSVGNFGEVYLGHLILTHQKTEPLKVAVKTLKDYPKDKHFRDFLNEIKLLQNVCEHPNVVKPYGALTQGMLRHKKPKIILEYCPLGDLRSYFKSLRDKSLGGEFFQDEINTESDTGGYRTIEMVASQTKPNYVQAQARIRTTHLFQWSYQIGNGMEYLASKGIVHRDLAARNILLTDNLEAKITDFGLAKDIQQSGKCYYSPSSCYGDEIPARWVALEALEERRFSTDSDIWSFGVTLWEIFNLCAFTPYHHIPDNEELISQLKLELEQESRLSKPRYASDGIYDIMLSCWGKERSSRPRFKDLKELIKREEENVLSKNPTGNYPPMSQSSYQTYQSYDGYESEESSASSAFTDTYRHSSISSTESRDNESIPLTQHKQVISDTTTFIVPGTLT